MRDVTGLVVTWGHPDDGDLVVLTCVCGKRIKFGLSCGDAEIGKKCPECGRSYDYELEDDTSVEVRIFENDLHST